MELTPKPGPYGKVDVGPERFWRGGAYSYPISAITEASFLAKLPSGHTVTTWKPGKSEKRLQTLGAHATGQVTTLETAPEFLREGPASAGPERLRQVMKAALVIGGDVGGPGAGIYDFGRQARFAQQQYRYIPAEEGRTISPVAPGAVFMPGSEMALAAGVTGERTGKWRYQVEDVFRGEEGGYHFALTRSAAMDQARVAFKEASTKVQGIRGDLSQVTELGGGPLGIQLMAGMKDVQGAIFSPLLNRTFTGT
jgi:hypothetical protein